MTLDFATYHAIGTLLNRSNTLLDGTDLSAWPDLFIPEGEYCLQSRENALANWPLAIMHLTSQGMLRDRIYAAQETIYHAPYAQRHICGAPSITELADGAFAVESAFLVMRTQYDKLPEVLALGQYQDLIVRSNVGFLFSKRRAVFDNDLLPNSVIKPI